MGAKKGAAVSEQTQTVRGGAPRVRGSVPRAVPRCVTVKRDLDQLVIREMEERGVAYSRIVEEALMAFLGVRAA